MNADASFDRVRAYVEGTLSPAERAAFSAEMAADRELSETAALYAEVRAATDDPAPPCRATADDLVLDDVTDPHDPWTAPVPSLAAARSRRVAAAAAILLVVGAGLAWYATRPIEPTAPAVLPELALEAVPLERTAPVGDAHPISPTTLAAIAAYEPAAGSSLASLTDLDVARAVSAATGRPLLAFVYHPTCPWCVAIAKGPFKDAAIAEAADRFVFARLDVTKTPESVWNGFDVWPIFWIEDASGARKHVFGGEQTSASLAKELAAGTAAAPVPDGVLPWPAARDLARGLSEADPARRYAAAVLAETKSPRCDLLAYAAAFLASEREAARLALEKARAETARGGVPAGRAALDAALPRFAGTPLGVDLERVRTRLEKDGVFPRLAPPAPKRTEDPR